ncbi:MAG: arylsulfatase A-like enzyme [Patescibacteria group bacterium]|jgi:arylsulfatase A-like enzyme
MKRPLKFTYINYALFLTLLLSSITILVTILSPLTPRIINTSFIYIFLSITFLFSCAMYVNARKRQANFYKIFFIILTFIYSLSYIWGSISFLLTNQIFRAQSLFFVYQIFPKTTIFLMLIAIILLFSSLVFVFNRKVHFSLTPQKKIKRIRLITILSIIFLFTFIFISPTFFTIYDPLVENYIFGDVVFISPEPIVSEDLIDHTTNLTNPNVIFILLESVSANRLGVYGYDRNVTPNLDYLAANGIVFDNAYTTATHSDYAQPTFLSSRYMIANNIRNFYTDKFSRKNAWEVFSDHGYSTTYISSQDDRWADMQSYYSLDSLDRYSYSMTDGESDYGTGLAMNDYDDRTMDEIVTFLEEDVSENPFFLYTNLQATHTPMVYPDGYNFYSPDDVLFLGLFNLNPFANTINRYDNSLRYVDLQIGRLLTSLEKENLLNNTMIIISSDHGHDFFSEHNSIGHGLSIYNDELLVPLIFYSPDLTPQRIKTPVSHIDVLPTVTDILGWEQYDEFIGKPMQKENRLFFYTQNHKYMVGMLENDIKTIVNMNTRIVEVYNLSSDPNELSNLADSHNFDSDIVTILLWDYCQKNYFTKVDFDSSLEKYCINF